MDKTAQLTKTYLPDKQGCYRAKHLKFNLFHRSKLHTDYIDLSYISFAESIEEAGRIVGKCDDVSYGYFDHTNWVVMPFENTVGTSDSHVPDNYHLDSKLLFEQAVSMGRSIHKVEQLHEFGTDFIRIRYS
jgi:hypothetical protein